ncbi:glycosyltransferase family 2 protein [Paenibacillus harenae]|uniref:glycosyltransferase family 2 protein n=1 Tax=Paenibacillus harenae TaxID=306543 RepID=UPI0027916A8C|nr:glycosyltransferase family 2 protein [Paenibacillus harenae]MDQ0060615.1 glycosyltransferase involved in cell wall biosynthesis [Paenibacillus harenae]
MPEMNNFCGKYERYPDLTGSRKFEGGLRIQGKLKTSTLEMPLVTVITVVYNAGSNIQRAMNSVFQQTYANIEYIIVDGGSTDNTMEYVRQSIDRLDYVVSEPDKGIYSAMNKGIELARGDYIALLNSDDWYTPEGIERSVKKLLAESTDYSGGDALLVDASGQTVFQFGVHHFDMRAYFSLNPCSHIAMVLHRRVYETIGPYDVQYRIASDLKYQLSIVRAGFKASSVNHVVCYMELEGISSREQNLSIDEVKRILAEFHPELSREEIEAIPQLKYRNQLTYYTLDMLLRVLSSAYYTEEQKAFIQDRVQDCFKATMYALLHADEPKPTAQAVQYYDNMKIRALFKHKAAKRLRGTPFFKPISSMYRMLKKFRQRRKS